MWWALTSRITIRRRTAFVVEAAAAAQTMSVAAQPGRASLLEVSVAGTGTVYATGLVSGVTTTASLAFTGTPTVKQTTSLFSSVSGVTTTGFAGAPTLSVRAVGRDGAPQLSTAILVAGWPASVTEGEPQRSSVSLPGRTEDGTAWWTVPHSETFEPRAGDLFDDERGRRFEVLGVPRPGGGNYPGPHWLVRTQRREGDS